MKEKKAKQNLQSPNERISAQERGFTQNGRKQMEMVFGDLDQPITDIMWMLGCKFLFDVPDWLS